MVFSASASHSATTWRCPWPAALSSGIEDDDAETAEDVSAAAGEVEPAIVEVNGDRHQGDFNGCHNDLGSTIELVPPGRLSQTSLRAAAGAVVSRPIFIEAASP